MTLKEVDYSYEYERFKRVFKIFCIGCIALGLNSCVYSNYKKNRIIKSSITIEVISLAIFGSYKINARWKI